MAGYMRFLTIARFDHRAFPCFQQLAEQFAVDGIVFGNEGFNHDCLTDLTALSPRILLTLAPLTWLDQIFQLPYESV